MLAGEIIGGRLYTQPRPAMPQRWRFRRWSWMLVALIIEDARWCRWVVDLG